MNAVVEIGFDYSALETSDRDQVREAAVRIRLRMARTASDIVEIGRDLILVKEYVGHGGFIRWIEAEFGMAERTARNFISVAERFGAKSATVADLSPTVLYALAAPSTPDAVVEEVMDRAAAGEPITRDDVKALKEQWAAEKQEFKQQIADAKAKVTDAKATQTDALQQVEEMRAEIARIRDEREALRQELAVVTSPTGSKPVSPADRPLNDFEAEQKWLAEGVRWLNKGSQEWRERARDHLFPDTPIMDRKWK